MLNISPFTYGMTIVQIFDQGTMSSPHDLDIEESELIDRFLLGIKTIAAISLALAYLPSSMLTRISLRFLLLLSTPLTVLRR